MGVSHSLMRLRSMGAPTDFQVAVKPSANAANEVKSQQLYPDGFGVFDPERFPEAPEENQLFDRGRAANLIDGEV